MILPFLNRDRERARLSHALASSNGTFCCLYGRRRCGKSRLIREVLPDTLSVYYVGDRREAGLQRRALAAAIGLKNLSISNAVASEVERLKPTVSAVNAREEANRSALERIQVLETQRSQSVLVYLRDMTDRVPKTAYLTTFRFKGDRVEVDGIADNASGLISLLERSPYFKNVEFTAPTTKYLQSQERFSLRMGLEK